MTFKKKVIDRILAREGGYVNDSRDSGGETNYGITVQVARENGYQGPMVDLPEQIARGIYERRYWDAVRADEVETMSEHVAEELVDTSVNMGAPRAVMFLQRSLNVLNRGGELYGDLRVDGVIGSSTLSALAAYLATRNELVLVRALNCLQGAFYIELAERREKDERFVYGWLKERVVV